MIRFRFRRHPVRRERPEPIAMYLTAHTAVGVAAAAAITTNPVAAFGIGWFSHYLVDFIPHGDEQAGEWTRRGNEIRRYLVLAGADGLLASALFLAQAASHGFSWVSAMAFIGSTVPDVMWGLEKLFKRIIFGPLQRFHLAVHNRLRVRLPTWLGLLVQAAVAGWFWSRLIG